MPGIFLMVPAFRPSDGINSGRRPEDRSGRTNCLSSAITRGFFNRRASPPWPRRLCSVPDTTPACSPTTITVDPSTQKYLPFWSLPNSGIKPGTNGDIGKFTFVGQQVVTENFFTTRADYRISGKDSLDATYLRDVTPYSSPDGLDTVL